MDDAVILLERCTCTSFFDLFYIFNSSLTGMPLLTHSNLVPGRTLKSQSGGVPSKVRSDQIDHIKGCYDLFVVHVFSRPYSDCSSFAN